MCCHPHQGSHNTVLTDRQLQYLMGESIFGHARAATEIVKT